MRFYAEFVIYLLLLINVLRVFVIKRVKQDSLSILAIIAFLFSFCYFFAFGLSVFFIHLITVSLYVLCINIHAFWRIQDRLFIDRFSITMKVFCAIAVFLIGGVFIFSYIKRPYNLSQKELKLKTTKINYEGDLQTGFSKVRTFKNPTMTLTEFTLMNETNTKKPVVIFIPDIRGDCSSYLPYLQLLSTKGYTVCISDFYLKDCYWGVKTKFLKQTRKYKLTKMTLQNPQEFSALEDIFVLNIRKICDLLMPVLKEHYGDKTEFFFISDGISSVAVEEFRKERPEIYGTFYLDSIKEFRTSRFGFLEMTDPYFAKKMDVKKDKDGFITKYLVLKSNDRIIEARRRK